MNAPTPEEIEELLSQSVERLSELLKMLYPDPDPDLMNAANDTPLINPEILTLDSFKWRYRFTGLGALAVTAIEQAQRITRDIGKFEDIGLCEFHIGLIYMHCQDYRGAAQQFREAWQQWSFVDKTAAVSLAYLAEAAALHRTHAYEAALGLYGKVEQMKHRIHLEPAPHSRDLFLKNFDDYLKLLQQAAHTALEEQTTPEEEAANRSETAVPDNQIIVPSPTFTSQSSPGQFTTPIPEHINTNSQFTWYQVHIRRQDNLFANIEEDGWLLVDTQASEHDFMPNELVVIISNDQNACITLKPPLQDDQRLPRIVLARVNFEGRFTRENGPVQFSSETIQIPAPEHIFGYVVGLWLEAGESEILGR